MSELKQLRARFRGVSKWHRDEADVKRLMYDFAMFAKGLSVDVAYHHELIKALFLLSAALLVEDDTIFVLVGKVDSIIFRY